MYNSIVSFIHSLYGTDEFVPLYSPLFIGNEKRYFSECIDATSVSSVGQFVDRFEKGIAIYTDAKKTVVCVSGINALYMAVLLIGVEREDEILTQALTFIVTCNTISYIGAHPVSIDVDRVTLGLSPRAVNIWLEGNVELKNGVCYNKNSDRRIKTCISIHTFGHPVKIDELVTICDDRHIELIEDAAEDIGSFYKGKHAGMSGKMGVISSNSSKTITMGGDGMLLFQDEELGKLAKHLTTQTKVPHRWAFIHDHVGYNYRTPDIDAALGCTQLENLERYVRDKRETAKKYRKFFATVPDVVFFTEPENCRSDYWLNVILLKDKATQQKFLEYTSEYGVMTHPVWELMSRLTIFKRCEIDGLENIRWLADRIVNIPSSVRLAQ